MEPSNKLVKKPISPSRELLDLLEEWVAPDVSEVKRKEYTGKTNFLGVPIAQLYESKKVEVVEEHVEEIKPLTAEEIEQIRQDAYQEGFQQGQQEGFEKGLEEGREAGQKQGYEDGQQQGYDAGLLAGQEELNARLEHWSKLMTALYEPLAELDIAAEKQLVNLAIMLAEAVIRVESKLNKDSLLTIIEEAVASLPINTDFVEVHIHPEDSQFLSQHFSEQEISERKWLIKEHDNYELGDVVVTTPNSLIDRTVQQRMKQTLSQFVEQVGLNLPIDQKLVKQAASRWHYQSEQSEPLAVASEPQEAEAESISDGSSEQDNAVGEQDHEPTGN